MVIPVPEQPHLKKNRFSIPKGDFAMKDVRLRFRRSGALLVLHHARPVCSAQALNRQTQSWFLTRQEWPRFTTLSWFNPWGCRGSSSGACGGFLTKTATGTRHAQQNRRPGAKGSSLVAPSAPQPNQITKEHTMGTPTGTIANKQSNTTDFLCLPGQPGGVPSFPIDGTI